MANLIFLASYPKSGNTWVRTFISNLINEKDECVNINNLNTDGIYSSRQILDSVMGIESSDLSPEEADIQRPKVYNHLAKKINRNLYIKAHDAYTYLEDGTPLFSTVNTKAIYIIRNPLDVAVSFANHISKDLDTSIEYMRTPDFCFCLNDHNATPQLRQKLLSWSLHVESWVKASEIDVHFVRYEDMKLDAYNTFKKIVEFIGLDYNETQIQKAISKSDFNILKEQEQKNGFKERLGKCNSFFRKGEVGDWRNHLSQEQSAKIINDNKEMMKQFGYLDKDNNPIY